MSRTEASTVLDQYRAEVEAHPESIDAKCNLGWGHYGARQYDEAVEVFREALKMDAASVDAMWGLGLSLKEGGRHEEAIPVFVKVMRLAPQKEPGARGTMLARLARGHINQIKKGDWDLDEEMRYEEPSEYSSGVQK